MPSSAGKKNALDRKSTRLNSSHGSISYAVLCLKKKHRRPSPRPRVLHHPPPLTGVRGRPCAHAGSRGGRAREWEWRRKACQGAVFFFFNDTATTEIYTLSLHDALPI